MPETITTSPEQNRSPEHQDMIDRLEALVELPAEYLESTEYDEKAFQGIGVADVEAMMARLYPDAEAGEITTRATRLFNRIAIENHNLPVPADLSAMDTTSRTARMNPWDVMEYAATHLRHRLDLSDPADSEEFNRVVGSAADRALDARGHSDQEFRDYAKNKLMDSAHNSINPAGKYPTLPEY